MSIFIHETAIIDDHVKIGKNTKIWAYTHIMWGVEIGDNCVIGEGVHIGKNIKIGNNCKIQNHALLYEGVHLEDNVFIGPGVVTTNDILPDTNDDWTDRFRTTLFKKQSSIGANSTILCGLTIEEGTLVGAGSVITKSTKKNGIYLGNPGKLYKMKE